MPVQLPPPRRLPDADRMLEQILAEGHAAPVERNRRPKAVISGLLVAAAAVAVAAVAVPIVVHRGGDTIAATPSGTPVSPSAPTATPPEHPTTSRLALGQSVTFQHFTVRVTQVSHHPMFGILIKAAVCVRSLPPNPTGATTRVSWEPWTVATGENRASASLRKAPAGVPAPKDIFPRERYLRVGQCASGWIPFNADEHSDVVAVLYANSLGDTAAWAGQ